MRPLRPALTLMFAALTACQQPLPAPVTPADAQRTAPPPVAPRAVEEARLVSSLAGAWRVAGIDGSPIDEPIALALTGDETRLWWDPQCAGQARLYRIEGQRISFASPHPPRAAGEPGPPVCSIGLPPRLTDVFRALDDAATVVRTPTNGVLISGPAHSVTLFSQ